MAKDCSRGEVETKKSKGLACDYVVITQSLAWLLVHDHLRVWQEKNHRMSEDVTGWWWAGVLSHSVVSDSL